MVTIYADFNARSELDRVWLHTVGSQESLKETQAQPGDWVWLSDGELRVGARLVLEEGRLAAEVVWDSLEEVIPEGDERKHPEAVRAALHALREALPSNVSQVLRLLPLVENALPRKGQAEYLRSRALYQLGYRELSLQAVEEALAKAPDDVAFQYQRLYLLREVDLDRALEEAKDAYPRRKELPAALMEAHAMSLAADARRSQGTDQHGRDLQLLELTAGFDTAPGRETVPPSLITSVHILRGFAFSRCGERQKASTEFALAIAATPNRPEAYAARGLEDYPSEGSITDLRRSIELGAMFFWPFYFLAHHAVSRRDWKEAEWFTTRALRLQPPSHVAANLLEWLAIVEFELRGDIVSARRKMLEALALAPRNAHLRRNLELLESIAATSPRRSEAAWQVQRDVEARAKDLQEAA